MCIFELFDLQTYKTPSLAFESNLIWLNKLRFCQFVLFSDNELGKFLNFVNSVLNNCIMTCCLFSSNWPWLKFISVSFLGRLNSWVVSHSALIFGTLCHALGHEFKPLWRQTLFRTNSFSDQLFFGPTLFRTQAQHLRFIHDSIFLYFSIL